MTSWRLQEGEVVYRLRAKVVIFFTHTMGIGRGADSRPSVSLRRGGESPPFDTAVRGEVVLQLARNEREKVVEK